jgi:toxin ParE1/3/4
MSFVLRPQAEEDIFVIARYIADHNPRAALDWRLDILNACRMLGEMPRSGVSRDDVRLGLRMFPKGNYLILFEIVENGIAVTRVIHGSRNWPKLFR